MASRKSDDSVWRALRSTVKGIEDVRVHVGIVGSAASEPHAGGELTNAEVGAIHEFGAPRANIPERSFIRSTFRTRRDELIALQASAARAILERRMTVTRALGLIGAWAAGACRDQIVKYGPFLFQPLSARTIARKGKSAPLVDTGQLVRSITYVVQK